MLIYSAPTIVYRNVTSTQGFYISFSQQCPARFHGFRDRVSGLIFGFCFFSSAETIFFYRTITSTFYRLKSAFFFLLSFSWNQLSILSWQRRRVKYIITFWLVGISKSRSAPLCSLHSTLLVRWSVGQSVGRSVIPFQPAFTHEVIPPSLSLSVYPPPLKSQPID